MFLWLVLHTSLGIYEDVFLCNFLDFVLVLTCSFMALGV